MDESMKFSFETIEKVKRLKQCLAEGMSIDRVIKELNLSEDAFFQLYELALSDEYNHQIAQIRQIETDRFKERLNDLIHLKAKEEEKEKEKAERETKEKINPLSVLTEEDVSQLQVLVVEYSINTSEVKSYFLGSMETICQKYWVAFEPSMSEPSICQAIKNKMTEKGIHHVRNLRFMEPFSAFMEYQEAMKTKKKKDLVKFEMDDRLLAIARERIGL